MASSNCIMAGARHPFIINVIGWQVSCLSPSTYFFSNPDGRHVTVLRGHDSLYDVSPGFFWLNPYGPAAKPRFSLHVVGAHPKYAGDLMPVCMLGAIP